MGHALQGAPGLPVAWPEDPRVGSATPGKVGMWIFLLSDGFAFGALLVALAVLRSGQATWRAATEPALGLGFTGALTAVLLTSSATCALAHAAAVEGRRAAAAGLLALTAVLGALFVLGQVQEWFGLVGPGLIREGLVFGRSARASTFYVITGFHGLHVTAGVIYLLAVLGRTARGVARAGEVELVALFWHFVDLIWNLVFVLVYLIPTGAVG
jgi:heme/copper-type cytochrome/quinol oxidase subunit 3